MALLTNFELVYFILFGLTPENRLVWDWAYPFSFQHLV